MEKRWKNKFERRFDEEGEDEENDDEDDETWKTVSKALVMESKLEVGLPSGKLKWPPKSWRR